MQPSKDDFESLIKYIQKINYLNIEKAIILKLTKNILKNIIKEAMTNEEIAINGIRQWENNYGNISPKSDLNIMLQARSMLVHIAMSIPGNFDRKKFLEIIPLYGDKYTSYNDIMAALDMIKNNLELPT